MSELSPQGGSEGYGACDDEVRVERCGKSAPDGWRLSVAVNSIRSNTGMGAGGPTPKAGPAAPGVAGAYRQRCVEIDDCQIQNPAYSFARIDTAPSAQYAGGAFLLPPLFLFSIWSAYAPFCFSWGQEIRKTQCPQLPLYRRAFPLPFPVD